MNVNYLCGLCSGWVIVVVRVIYLGCIIYVWDICFSGDDGKLSCIVCLIMVVVLLVGRVGRVG